MNTYNSVWLNEAVFPPQHTMEDTINKTKLKTPIELIQGKYQMGTKQKMFNHTAGPQDFKLPAAYMHYVIQDTTSFHAAFKTKNAYTIQS